MPKQDRNIIPQNQTEIKILDLEKEYFQCLANIFHNSYFAQNMHDMSAWINANYLYLQSKEISENSDQLLPSEK